MKKTWYAAEGSKLAEFWTILHLPYTAMSISFLLIGFGIAGVQRWDVLAWTTAAYFMGLGIAAHSFDQLPGQGSSYVRYLTPMDLMRLGATAVGIAVMIGVTLMAKLGAWHLLWLIPLQTFFVFAYPLSKFAKGAFHNDISFAVSFGFIPVMVGYYLNTLTITAELIPWALVAALISWIEITLSREVRLLRRELSTLPSGLNPNDFQFFSTMKKGERALKLLCILSYLLAIIFLVR